LRQPGDPGDTQHNRRGSGDDQASARAMHDAVRRTIVMRSWQIPSTASRSSVHHRRASAIVSKGPVSVTR
jgi:hypothetical protein